MTKDSLISKQTMKVLLCIMASFTLCIGPVRKTSSYVTSLSDTCENTFVAEIKTDKPDKGESTSPTKGDKKTGDDTKLELYMAGIVASLLGIAVLTRWKLKIKYKLN